MEFGKRMLPIILLLALILVAAVEAMRPEMMAEVSQPTVAPQPAAGLPGFSNDKRMCEWESREFRGLCLSFYVCSAVCRTEGSSDGKCRGLRLKCICFKDC